MKKLTWFLVGLLTAVSMNVFAQINEPLFDEGGSSLADVKNFDDWYKPSVLKMELNTVIEGYPDGEFKPGNYVNRAELAVILDRLASVVGGLDAVVCTRDIRAGVKIILRDQSGQPLSGASISAKDEEYKSVFTDFYESEEAPGIYYGLDENSGTSELTIQKEGYLDHVESVYVPLTHLNERGCHVVTQTKNIIMIAK